MESQSRDEQWQQDQPRLLRTSGRCSSLALTRRDIRVRREMISQQTLPSASLTRPMSYDDRSCYYDGVQGLENGF